MRHNTKIVMMLIEPCCVQKLIPQLREKLDGGGTTFIHGRGDLSIAELLPELLLPHTEAELMIVAPGVPDIAARTIESLMDRRMPQPGKGQVWLVKQLTLITNLKKNPKYISAGWLKENPFGERLQLKHCQQNDTAILLPDMAIVGPVNMAYNGHFTAIATRRKRTIEDLRATYMGL